MRLTKEEKKICKEYGGSGRKYPVRCHMCPLRLPWYLNTCKATATKAEWEDYMRYQKEHTGYDWVGNDIYE